MKVAGIDENGRGSLIGPLVITCFIIKENEIEKLKEIGVKDSKKLTKEKREEIFEKLKNFDFYYELIFPVEIDIFLKKGSLNDLEAIYMANLINRTDAEKYFIDSPSNPINFQNKIRNYLKRDVELVVGSKMDEKNFVVAAASIIGKIIRDREIKKIEEEIKEEIGSGYPADKKTIEFLKNSLKNGKNYDFIRKSWITYEKEKLKSKFKKITDFI